VTKRAKPVLVFIAFPARRDCKNDKYLSNLPPSMIWGREILILPQSQMLKRDTNGITTNRATASI